MSSGIELRAGRILILNEELNRFGNDKGLINSMQSGTSLDLAGDRPKEKALTMLAWTGIFVNKAKTNSRITELVTNGGEGSNFFHEIVKTLGKYALSGEIEYESFGERYRMIFGNGSVETMSSEIVYENETPSVGELELSVAAYAAMTGVFLTEQVSKEVVDSLSDKDLEGLVIDTFGSIPVSEIRKSIQDGADLSVGTMSNIIRENDIKIKNKDSGAGIPSTLNSVEAGGGIKGNTP